MKANKHEAMWSVSRRGLRRQQVGDGAPGEQLAE